MVEKDEDALICDFAQYYNIYDYTKLQPSMAAVLAYGLPDESRIKRILRDEPVATNTLLLAAALDELRFLSWAQTEDGQQGKNKPKSVYVEITKKKSTDTPQENKQGLTAYSSADDFMKARKELLEKVKNKG